MTIALYVDEDSQDSSLIRALRSRGVDVIAASEAGMNGRLDDEQLQWSTTNARVLYSRNTRDFYKLQLYKTERWNVFELPNAANP
jgi:post-segregation antitoxin (ccd killing protein)